MANDILVATATVQATIDGEEVLLVAGKTTVREGHSLLVGREHMFAPLLPTFEVDPVQEPKTPSRQSKAGGSSSAGGGSSAS